MNSDRIHKLEGINRLVQSLRLESYKFSISIDEDLLEWFRWADQDETICIRSHGIEFALTQLKEES